MNKVSVPAGIAWIAFSIFFSFSLLVSKVGNIAFYLLVLLALGHVCIAKWDRSVVWGWWRQYKWLYVSCAGMAIAIFITEVFQGSVQARSYDNASKMALLGVLTWAALLMPVHYIRSLRWAFVLGAFLATIKLFVSTSSGVERVGLVGFVPIIAYSQLALLMALFALLSIVWSSRSQPVKTALLAITGCVGLYNIYISQTRGAWIAIPVFVALGLITFSKRVRAGRTMLWSLLLVLLLIGSVSTTNIVRSRVNQAISDVHLYSEKKNLDTSVGTRFQLWNASWILFKEHPWFGVGKEGFSRALEELSEKKILTPDAASYPHSHNEVLYNMAILGVFGLLGILAIYLVPIFYFVREIRHQDRQVKAAAAMGIGLCLGYLVFGLVDVMFMWRVCDIFYSMAIALFLAFIVRRKDELHHA